MFGLFKSKPIYDKFYEEHKLSGASERLLSIGALLAEANQARDSVTLKSRWPAKDLAGLLGQAWQIFNKQDTVSLLEELLLLPSTGKNYPLIKHVIVERNVSGIPDVVKELLLDGGLYDHIDNYCGKIFTEKKMPVNEKTFDAIHDLAAWDIERAGLIARYAYNSGWLSQAEALNYLERLYAIVLNKYSGWQTYYLAYLKGRALFYDRDTNDSLEYIFTLKDLFSKEEYFCNRYIL